VPPPAIVLLTCENAVLMLVVSIGIDAAKATAIKPTNTAYSTAVGPSSLVKKFRTLVIIVFIANSFSMKLG
jgi:lipid-binding SYLF domain-containing protein